MESVYAGEQVTARRFGHVSPTGVRAKLKGIYRALDLSAPDAYWANFIEEIFPKGVDPPPPPRHVFMTFDDLYRTTSALIRLIEEMSPLEEDSDRC